LTVKGSAVASDPTVTGPIKEAWSDARRVSVERPPDTDAPLESTCRAGGAAERRPRSPCVERGGAPPMTTLFTNVSVPWKTPEAKTSKDAGPVGPPTSTLPRGTTVRWVTISVSTTSVSTSRIWVRMVWAQTSWALTALKAAHPGRRGCMCEFVIF
jgi:hypothetical protein